MAVNANAALKNRHVVIIGTSGAGKSQVCKNLIPRRGVRFIAFDPEGEHDAHGFEKLSEFARQLMRADRSGKPFRVAYTGAKNSGEFEKFCRAVWDVLDGRTDTHILLEEAAQFTRGSGPADEAFRNLLLRSRKYGGILYVVGQRPAEIPTTARNQCGLKLVGLLDGSHDSREAAKMIDVPADELMKIAPDTLTFYRKEKGIPAKKVKFKYLG